MARKWYTSKVIRKEQEAPNTFRFWLDYPDDEDFKFTAGQFITCDLPIGEKRLDKWRSYSIANIPSKQEGIELCIVLLEGGRASGYFKNLSIGEEITFKGPEGQFVIPSNNQHELVFICTGTGIAPFRSMILDQIQRNDHQKMTLIFGTRSIDGMLYHEEMSRLAISKEWFNYKVALSRASFNGYQGYVHELYQDIAINDQSCHFYICGWSQMVDNAKDLLLNTYHVDASRVHYELYG